MADHGKSTSDVENTRDARDHPDRRALHLAMSLSLWLGVLMLAIKMGAYLLTGSAAILSDAAESVVHVAAVCFAAYSLRLRYRPADECHPYGHAKISFFSAGFEGTMILLAAVYIIFEAVHKWLGGLHLEHLGLGTLLIALAMLINGALGWYLLWLGKRKHSIIVEANGRHVLTDCWTSLGVLVGLGLAQFTGWLPWDPIFAILMALNIFWAGVVLIRRSVTGLMDKAEPDIQRRLGEVLGAQARRHGVGFHDLRARNIGDAHWVEVHLLFPDTMPIGRAHRIATQVEEALAAILAPGSHVTSHLEAAEDHSQVHAAHD